MYLLFACICSCLHIFVFVLRMPVNVCANMHVIIVFVAYLYIFAYIVHIRTYLKKMRGAICYKMNVSRASGAACGSSYGRFCIFIKNKLKPVCAYCENRFWLKPVFDLTGFWACSIETGSVTGFRFGSRPSCFARSTSMEVPLGGIKIARNWLLSSWFY